MFKPELRFAFYGRFQVRYRNFAIESMNDVSLFSDFVHQIKQCLPAVGVPVQNPPKLVQLGKSDRDQDYIQALKQHLTADVSTTIDILCPILFGPIKT